MGVVRASWSSRFWRNAAPSLLVYPDQIHQAAHRRFFALSLSSVWFFTILVFGSQQPISAQDDTAAVRVDGRTVFRVSGRDGMDAAARVREIERRFAPLLQNPQAIAPATIAHRDQDRPISVAGVPIVTVYPSDAQNNVTDVDTLASRWAAAVDVSLNRVRERRVSEWGRFSSDVQASIETAFARLAEPVIKVIPSAFAATLVLGLFWGLAAGIRALMRAIFCRIVEDKTTENLIKQVAYYAVWALGLIVAADALGFDPQTVVTGLGLTGLALGFALKDIISNFVSGILILTSRPFEIGDQIAVEDTEGNIERIELRATQIRTYDGRVVFVPNADILTSRITNNTAHPLRRGSVEMYIGYDSDLRLAGSVMATAAQNSDGVLEEPATSVRLRELGPDDIVFEVRFWTDSRRSDFVATSSAVRENVVSALKNAGVGLPDPAERVVKIQSQSADS